MVDLGDRFRRGPGVVSRRIAGESVLVPTMRASYLPEHKAAELYVLNATGEHLWSMLEQPRSLTELVDGLVESFEVARPVAEEHVRLFLDELLGLGVVLPEDEA